MADLTERGQILLIAAFALAVTFVALALVVNSAIFTENLASRGEVAGSSEALLYQHQVRQGVGGAMAFANIYNESNLAASLRESISDVGRIGGLQQATAGQLVNVSYRGQTGGTRIADNESGWSTFEGQSGSDDWQLGDRVDRTRKLQITTDYGELPSSSDKFKLVANESGTDTNIWSVEIWKSSPNVVIEVDPVSGSPAECRHDVFTAGEFQIDITKGVVNGERCHALTRTGTAGTPMWFANGLSGTSYNISIENGDQIRGNYSMVITPRGSWNGTHLATTPSPGSPFRSDAVYSTTVDYLFVTPGVDYEAEIRVAPGEPP